jgi:hypothetical protein
MKGPKGLTHIEIGAVLGNLGVFSVVALYLVVF